MLELFHQLSDWLLAFADSPWAIGILMATSFSESIFFPIPPDPLLIGIAIPQQGSALWLAALVTLFSVAGALVGHWLGMKFGSPILHRFVSDRKVATVENMFRKYGMWAVLLAAFTPIPYKVFAVTAGVLKLERRPFIIASLIGRGARFMIIGGLIFFFGESIQVFISDQFELLTLITAVALVLLLIGVFVFAKVRKSRKLASEV
ncbi:MAG: DedA family protein [Chloroflexi bacterium]|nr:DedA family protein [Chloroflexota bacterium]MDA1228932.1 DedA family protein [Chloroflexota bacterium]